MIITGLILTKKYSKYHKPSTVTLKPNNYCLVIKKKTTVKVWSSEKEGFVGLIKSPSLTCHTEPWNYA